jgi:hypothetical protein
MVTLVTFSLSRNLQLEEGQVNNLLTEDTCRVGMVTPNLGNLLTEEKPAVGGGSG